MSEMWIVMSHHHFRNQYRPVYVCHSYEAARTAMRTVADRYMDDPSEPMPALWITPVEVVP